MLEVWWIHGISIYGDKWSVGSGVSRGRTKCWQWEDESWVFEEFCGVYIFAWAGDIRGDERVRGSWQGYVCAERFYRLMDDNGDDSKDAVAPATTGKRTISFTDQATVHTISISDASISYGNVSSSTTDTQIFKQVSLKIQRVK